MPEKERGTDEPSLELPSLRLRRPRRVKAPQAPPEPEKRPRNKRERSPKRASKRPSERPSQRSSQRPARQPRPTRELALPAVGGTTAAVLTGALVGVIGVGLTWASLRLCEVVRGTSSCGGPGYLLLLLILVAMVLLGTVLLRALGVPEPGSTSLLAVGLLAVLTLLLLVGVLFHWWMILVLPACSALTFAAAHWVTTTFVEPAAR
jgi:hypothetical protein